jgi:hypothetical protein
MHHRLQLLPPLLLLLKVVLLLQLRLVLLLQLLGAVRKQHQVWCGDARAQARLLLITDAVAAACSPNKAAAEGLCEPCMLLLLLLWILIVVP